MTERRLGLRGSLLVAFLAVPLVLLTITGYAAWRVSEWAAERNVDQQLGDKLELAVDVVRQLVRERVETTGRLASANDVAGLRGSDLELAMVRDGHRSRVLHAARDLDLRTLDAALATLAPDAADPERRFALAAAGDRFLAIAAAPLPSGGVLVTARRVPPEVLRRFTALSGSEMGVFADWQRARVASFAIDVQQCQACHGPDWRVQRIGGDFHLARSFNGRGFFAATLDDDFRYAFMPLEIGGRRMAMIVVRQPLAAFAAARRQTLTLISGGGLLAMAMSIGAWWVVSRRLATTMSAVQQWLESLVDGRPAPEPPVQVRGEVQRLASSLTPTIKALRESRDQLHRMNAELDQMVGAQSSTISSMRERLGTFLELARAPEAVPEADEVAAQMLRHVGQLFGYAWGRLVFLDPAEEGRTRCVALGPSGAAPVPYDDRRDPVLLSAARHSRVPFHLDETLVAGAVRGGALVVPIAMRGQTLGALALGDRVGPRADADPDPETLEALVRQGAMALEHSFLYQRAQETYLHTTAVLVTTIEGKDPYLRGHSERVARMTVATASRFGIANGALRALEQVARFHDVGKICIDLSILLKPGRLTDEEYDSIKRHVEIGEAIVSQIESLRPHAHVVGQHHERFDGQGYLGGLGGEEISFEARIVAVCDAFDAMTSRRSYRAPRELVEAAEEIRRGSGRQFDPRVAAVFADVIAEGVATSSVPV